MAVPVFAGGVRRWELLGVARAGTDLSRGRLAVVSGNAGADDWTGAGWESGDGRSLCISSGARNLLHSGVGCGRPCKEQETCSAIDCDRGGNFVDRAVVLDLAPDRILE